MKDSPICLSDIRLDNVEFELREIKTKLQQVLDILSQGREQHDQIITAKDVAEMLVLDISNVYSKCVKGDIPHFKVGTRYRFRREEISAWMQKGKGGGTVNVDDYVNKYLQRNKLKP